MEKLLIILMITFLTSSALAADNQTVIMNTKTYIYHSPDCKWAKNVQRTVLKLPNKKPKLKEQGLVKSVGDECF